ncbi:hypothetical protein ACWDRR_05245 [Kitasatospora sp. NPDC003701]
MRRFLGRALVVSVAVALGGLGLWGVSSTAPHVAQAAGWSGVPGRYVRGVCAPSQEGPRDVCPGRFTPEHGEPVYSSVLQEDVRGSVVPPVRCADGVCHTTGVKAVAYWLAMALAALAALPAAGFLIVVGLSGANTWERLFVGLPVATGVMLGVAFLCFVLSGEAADRP